MANWCIRQHRDMVDSVTGGEFNYQDGMIICDVTSSCAIDVAQRNQNRRILTSEDNAKPQNMGTTAQRLTLHNASSQEIVGASVSQC